ncbi:AAA family ATPase [Taibaiella lutea]|nr:AAA family ATPase [Taibaiella lutea]
MKFNKIKISKSITSSKGIDEINLQRLSNVIALVGKNGSGKTRILRIFQENLLNDIKIQDIFDKSIVGMPKHIQNEVRQLEPYKDWFALREKLEIQKKYPSNTQNNIEIQLLKRKPNAQMQTHLSQQVQSMENEFLKGPITTLKQIYLRKIEYSEIQKLQDVLTEREENGSFENLIENVSNLVQYDELKSINKSALKFLAKLPHQLTFDYMDCMGEKSKYEERISHKRFLSLKKFVKDFLNKELTWERKSSTNTLTTTGVTGNFVGQWKFNGRDFDYTDFSDGEKVLFSYALLFFLLDQNPNLNIKECIILIDEPELHLHPDSEIDLINGLRQVIGETGQLIFATHSINILSNLNYDEIFMVKDGKIKHPSQETIGESLAELMSIEDRVNKLSDFLSSIATWTFVNFMTECFADPEVIESARPDDPQLIALKKAIAQSSTTSSNLLLDFGAGKGRLYEHLKSDSIFMSKVTYSALEIEPLFHENLKGMGAKNVYGKHSDLPKTHFDFILLCNVLHEIPIKEWVESINSIIEAINDNGFLIIIEAKILTKGERIGKEGFILLDLDELKVLFNMENLPSSIAVKGKEHVITCAVISKKQLNKIKIEDVDKTLKTLELNTFNKILKLRDERENTIGNGRKNAFLSQLHINSKIAQLSLKDEI